MQPELRQIAAEAYTDAFRRMVHGELVDIWGEVSGKVAAAVLERVRDAQLAAKPVLHFTPEPLPNKETAPD